MDMRTVSLDPQFPDSSDLQEMEQGVCPGNTLSCMGKCLEIHKICNGVPECSDFSDEGERK